EDHLEAMLSPQELEAANTRSFVLASTTDGIEYESIFSTGIIAKNLEEDNHIIKFKNETVNGRVSEIDDGAGI
ncbi:hypothetical protein, partial [Extibacter muris]|uniref:hypothetical protein n=1 Tax=Extibacter muris TaxID=1796622 RepID=UPI00210D9044